MYTTIILYFTFITASSDYNAVEGNLLTFTPGVNVSCTTVVPIIDDGVLEDNQTFNVVLSTTDPGVLLDPASATVAIVDNDGNIHLVLSTLSIPLQACIYHTFYHHRCHCGITAVILHCE